MESKKVLLIVVALMVIHGTVLAFGSKNQNSIASVSKLEMWHSFKCSIVACADTTQDALTKADLETLGSSTDDLFALQLLWCYMNESCLSQEDSILKNFSITREVVDEIGFQTVDLVDKQIRLGLTDAQIIKWTQTMVPLKVDDTIGSTNELVAPRRLYQYLDATAVEWIQSVAPLVSNDTVCSSKDFVDLQRICHCIDARVCSQLSVESDNQTTRILMSLHRICRYIDTAIYHLLGGKLVILDTDIGSSTDDMFALQMLCRYMDAGKCRLLGIIIDRYGENNVRVANFMLNYSGIDNLQVGVNSEPQEVISFVKYSEDDHPFMKYLDGIGFQYSVDEFSALPEGWVLYRQLLASAPNKSVEIISIGFLTQLSRLLTSQPDSISPLSGVELVDKKVSRIYIMGSKFLENCYDDTSGYNLENPSPYFADTVFNLCPSNVEIILSPDSVGESIGRYEDNVVLEDIQDYDNPIRLVYESGTVDTNQYMWDPMCVINCIEGDGLFHLSEPGFVHVEIISERKSRLVFTPDGSGNVRFQYLPSIWTEEDVKRFRDKIIWYIRQSY